MVRARDLWWLRVGEVHAAGGVCAAQERGWRLMKSHSPVLWHGALVMPFCFVTLSANGQGGQYQSPGFGDIEIAPSWKFRANDAAETDHSESRRHLEPWAGRCRSAVGWQRARVLRGPSRRPLGHTWFDKDPLGATPASPRARPPREHLLTCPVAAVLSPLRSRGRLWLNLAVSTVKGGLWASGTPSARQHDSRRLIRGMKPALGATQWQAREGACRRTQRSRGFWYQIQAKG